MFNRTARTMSAIAFSLSVCGAAADPDHLIKEVDIDEIKEAVSAIEPVSTSIEMESVSEKAMEIPNNATSDLFSEHSKSGVKDQSAPPCPPDCYQ